MGKWESRVRPVHSSDVLYQHADATVVLLNLARGQYFTLENTARRIWELTDGSRTVDDIITTICAEYSAERDVVESDTLELLTDLASEGLISETR